MSMHFAIERAACCAILLFWTGNIMSKNTIAAEGSMRADCTSAGLSHLSWDTEGTGREQRNLLRKDHLVRLEADGKAVAGFYGEAVENAPPCYAAEIPGGNATFCTAPDSLKIVVGAVGRKADAKLRLIFPFDPSVTPTTVFPASWDKEGRFSLPAVVSAPDFGLAHLTARGGKLVGRLEGSRTDKFADLILEFDAADDITIELKPFVLDPPAASISPEVWAKARRGWCNIFQPASRWGSVEKQFGAPSGMLSNNVISDPVSFALWPYSDAMRWKPEIAPGVSVVPLVRRTLEWWMDEKTSTTGECVGYWGYYDFLDSNPSLLIAAWNYVETTQDTEWLKSRIGDLEKLSGFLESRDVDGDGMVEGVQTGNRGSLHQPKRSSNWWDAVNCGWKDGYPNALIYRAWRCLADLEKRLGRDDKRAHYTALADKLKAVYAPTLMNPKTGRLAWWKSQDGELHDHATLIVNSMAIEYGLVDPEQGRKILTQLRDMMTSVGFVRHDLGIPCFLQPVPRYDYLLPDSLGCPKKEDGTDSFQHYMNGGVTGGHAFHWIAAHYAVGEKDYAEQYLRSMLGRQAEGKFQNGVTDQAPLGIDWTTWDGKPCGYEGYLSDNFRFLQAIMIGDEKLRAKQYSVLNAK